MSKVKINHVDVKPIVQSPKKYTSVHFYNVIRPILVFAQLFAVMPISGVFSSNVNHLHFRWRSFRTLHTIIVSIGLLIFTVFSIFHVFTKKLTIQNSTLIVFYFSNLYAMFGFLLVARKWPSVMKYWSNVEINLPPVNTKKEMHSMSYKIRLTAGLILCASVVEHLLLVSKGIAFSQNCSKIANGVEAYYRKSVPQIFNHIEFNMGRAMVCSFFMITSTFIWNYMDVFIIIISFGLSAKFRQINRIILEQKRKEASLEFWLEFRVHYQNLVDLCELVDKTICHITFVSFSNNFYFICIQLINVLDPTPTVVHAIYFWFSIAYLIVKSFYVSKGCAAINEQSKVPLDVLRSVPSGSWHPELKRFMDDIKNNDIGLTGLKFFTITKRTILTVAGAILTYDLVLISFRRYDELTNDPCFG